MSLEAYCIKHHGHGGEGSGASVVVAPNEQLALAALRSYFETKPDGYRQYSSMDLLEVELLQDSHLGGCPISLEISGVRLEYHYPPDSEAEILVYLGYSHELLADELDELQAKLNDGRGVSCVRSICTFLRHGEVGAARAVARNESDKIRSYPEIVDKLREVGFWYELRW